PSSVKVVGCKKQVDSYSRTVSTTFEYDYTEEWLLITATVRTLDNTVIVEGIEVHPLPGPLEKNKFTFAGKGPAQYVMFAIFCAVPLLTLFALVLCIRTKMKRKWLWIIFILLGIGRVTMNWTTGDVQAFETQVTKAHGAITYFHPYFAIQLLGAGYVRAPYGPWMLSVSLPLGALVFLYRRRYLQRKTGVPGN
ncbi:MAG TPA: hypothetical protein VG733_19445, partial [Chthoniobacteraceae bacterium]|nr:hypothetical protein [Chthoniobacteraceae bacterium]